MAEYCQGNGVDPFESADDASEISDEGGARKAQLADGRVSTLKRTKRKSLKPSKKRRRDETDAKSAEPPVPAPSTVEEILTAMSRDKEILETQVCSMTTLEEMVETDESHRRAVYTLGGINQILNALRHFRDNRSLATSGCWIISNLARLRATVAQWVRAAEGPVFNAQLDPDFFGLYFLKKLSIYTQLCESMVSAGAIGLILEAMKTHECVSVAHAGCAALCNIGIEEQWRKQLYNNGMIESVSEAMKEYPEEEWVQYTAIQALQNICNTGSLCPGVIDKGAVKTVKTAMEAMSDHDDLLQSACWTFSCLAFSTDDDYRTRMYRDGAVEAVVGGLQASPQHKGVQFTGCSALSNFARTKTIVPQMVKYGCVDVLVRVGSTFSTHQGILAVTYRTLVLLAADGEAKQQMHDSNLPSLFQKTLDTVNEGPAVTEAEQLNRLLSAKKGTCCCLL